MTLINLLTTRNYSVVPTIQERDIRIVDGPHRIVVGGGQWLTACEWEEENKEDRDLNETITMMSSIWSWVRINRVDVVLLRKLYQ